MNPQCKEDSRAFKQYLEVHQLIVIIILFYPFFGMSSRLLILDPSGFLLPRFLYFSAFFLVPKALMK